MFLPKCKKIFIVSNRKIDSEIEPLKLLICKSLKTQNVAVLLDLFFLSLSKGLERK